MTQTLYLNASDSGAIDTAAELLRQGKLVAFPTETVYGLGAYAFDIDAVTSVFEVKKRPRNNPIIIHVADIESAAALFAFDESPFETLFRERFATISTQFWPGPLTLVGRKAASVSDIVSGGSPKVAVRIPSHPIAHKLLQRCALPIAAPSANLFTRPSPTKSNHVALNLDSQVSAILDGGQCDFGIESTVLDIDGQAPKILRHGAVSVRELEKLLPDLDAGEAGAVSNGQRSSPGLASRHYSPAIAQVALESQCGLAKAWFSSSGLVLREQTAAQLFEKLGSRAAHAGPTRRLPNDAVGFARELFAAFYEMESEAIDSLVIEDLCSLQSDPEWIAVCDKLIRAQRS